MPISYFFCFWDCPNGYTLCLILSLHLLLSMTTSVRSSSASVWLLIGERCSGISSELIFTLAVNFSFIPQVRVAKPNKGLKRDQQNQIQDWKGTINRLYFVTCCLTEKILCFWSSDALKMFSYRRPRRRWWRRTKTASLAFFEPRPGTGW